MSLAKDFQQKIAPKLKAELVCQNNLAVPRLVKVTVNVGVGRWAKDKQYLDEVVANITAITGQKPVQVLAKKSISAFKVRQGDVAGVLTVLRGRRMYDFVEKLVNITLPRVRDFRGLVPQSVDNRGNLTIGFKEQTAFAEIQMEQVDKIHGLEVVLTTSAANQAAGLALFKALGFPFKKD